MSHVDRHTVSRVALVLVAVLAFVPRISAQTSDEWTTSWMAPTINVGEHARAVASAGPGEYVVVSWYDIHRTSDAGRTWMKMPRSVGARSRFTHVAYSTRSHMLIVVDSTYRPMEEEVHVGRIVASTDAGSTWIGAERRWAGEITSIAMLDDRHGLAGLDGWGFDTDSVLVTDDGGVSWTARPLPAGSHLPYEVFIVGSSSWYMLAYDLSTETPRLYRTTNAGAVWSSSPFPEGVYRFAMLDEGNIWGAGGVRPQDGSIDPYRDIIMRSTDGGMTWATALDTVLQYSLGIYSLAFADRDNAIAGGGSGQFYRTTDGGRTWERGWMPSERVTEYGRFRDLAYPVAGEAIAVTGGRGVIAYRGGRTIASPTIASPVSSNSPHPLEATVTWTPVEGATAYDLQIADTVYEFENVNHRYFDEPYIERFDLADTSLAVSFAPHRRYVIRVRARNEAMTGDWSKRVYVRSEGEGNLLPFPIITHPMNASTGQPLDLDLAWTPVDGAIGYDYRVALEQTFLFTHVDVENHQGTTAHVAGLRPNTEYWVRVRARDVDGVMSAYFTVVFFTGNTARVDDEPTIDFVASLQPNVSRELATLHVSLARSGAVRIDIVDAAGSIVRSDTRAHLDAGAHALPIDVSSLASGRYFVRVDVEGKGVSLPVLVVR